MNKNVFVIKLLGIFFEPILSNDRNDITTRNCNQYNVMQKYIRILLLTRSLFEFTLKSCMYYILLFVCICTL